MVKILIVEDDNVVYNELVKLLHNAGLNTVDGRIAENLVSDFDLALLDIGLPGTSGYDICIKIRKTKKCPIIFLTSMNKPENELMGFVVGGDDFISKPFNGDVLLARINYHLKTVRQETIQKGSMILDIIKMEAKNNQNCIALTKTEFALLRILIERVGVISRSELIEKLWNNENYIDENTLYVNIARLRAKLEEIGLKDSIKTIRGAGYRLECE